MGLRRSRSPAIRHERAVQLLDSEPVRGEHGPLVGLRSRAASTPTRACAARHYRAGWGLHESFMPQSSPPLKIVLRPWSARYTGRARRALCQT